jgi:hypothetical protein
MHFTYGFCDGNVGAVSRKYKHLYPDWRQPNRDVFIIIHHSLKETRTFIPPAHWLWQTMCQMKRKCSMLYMLICQLPLFRLHMNRASQNVLGHNTTCGAIVSCPCTTCTRTTGDNNLHLPFCWWLLHKLQMNLIIDLWSTVHKGWSKQSPQPI